MALRALRFEGDPILRKVAKPVKEINERIRQTLSDMVETMYEDNGVGLAGPQIGVLRRLVTIDVGEGPIKMINPEIIEKSEETELDIEGCLSLPKFNGTVIRPTTVTVKYLDENGEEHIKTGSHLFARCVCHEIDHLNGILFRDIVEKVIDMEHLTEDMIEYMRENNLLSQEKPEEE